MFGFLSIQRPIQKVLDGLGRFVFIRGISIQRYGEEGQLESLITKVRSFRGTAMPPIAAKGRWNHPFNPVIHAGGKDEYVGKNLIDY
jgi:hypothetical protein